MQRLAASGPRIRSAWFNNGSQQFLRSRFVGEFRGHHTWRVPGTPCLTAWANSGKSGRARIEQALRLMGIRPARLEPLALRASGHERMANRWAAASGEKRIELSETIAWFGDMLNLDGPLVEIGSRPVFNNSAVIRIIFSTCNALGQD